MRPVPLETVSTRPARNTEPNFTSFAAQLVTTLHQSDPQLASAFEVECLRLGVLEMDVA